MHCRGPRVLLPELLDDAPPDAARGNLAELVLINKYLGGHRILLDRLAELVAVDDAFSLLDVGSASGDMAKEAVQRFPKMRVVNMDQRLLHLEDATFDRLCGDAFRMPFRPLSFDFVHCSLFLHHFTDEQILELLASFWAIARRAIIVQDLERHPVAYYFLPATKWLFGWSPIVLHDGPISVEAAFKPDELRTLAKNAGLPKPSVRLHRPAFRISMVAVRS